MSRYYLFSGMDYYPSMAMRDYKGSFASVADAIAACVADGDYLQWAQVVAIQGNDLVQVAYSYGDVSDKSQFQLWAAGSDECFWDEAYKYRPDDPYWEREL